MSERRAGGWPEPMIDLNVPVGRSDETGCDAADDDDGLALALDPDVRAVVERLRDRWRSERERRLNAVDALIGAEAALAQAKADTDDVFYRLHVRESELNEARSRLAELEAIGAAETSVAAAAARLVRTIVAVARRAARSMRRL